MNGRRRPDPFRPFVQTRPVGNQPSRKHEHFTIQIVEKDAISPVTLAQEQATDVVVDISCPICQEPVGEPNADGVTESWSLLPCGHKFGSHCIKHWLGLTAGRGPSCPVCRRRTTYACGHPALPRVLSKKEARSIDGCIGRDKSYKIHSRACNYCKEVGFHCDNVGLVAAKCLVLRRTMKSIWLVTMRRAAGDMTEIAREDRHGHFQRWWNKQEPQSTDA